MVYKSLIKLTSVAELLYLVREFGNQIEQELLRYETLLAGGYITLSNMSESSRL